MPRLLAALAWLLAHREQLALSLGALSSLAILRPRAFGWLRVRAPRLYALAAAVIEISPEILKAGRLLLAVWNPKLLDQIEGPAEPPRAHASMRPTKLPPPPSFPPAVLCLALALAIGSAGCSGTQIQGTAGVTAAPDGGVASWQVGVSITLAALRAADTAGSAAVLASTQIPEPTRTDVLRALRVADDALDLAGAALADYQRAQTLERQCLLRHYVDSALTAALQAMTLLRDAGVQVPPELVAAVGGLGAVGDALLPGCVGAPATARVRAALVPR